MSIPIKLKFNTTNDYQINSNVTNCPSNKVRYCQSQQIQYNTTYVYQVKQNIVVAYQIKDYTTNVYHMNHNITLSCK